MPLSFAIHAVTAVGKKPRFDQAPQPAFHAVRRVVPLFVASLLAFAATVGAAEPLPTGATHRGTVSAGPYQIFPENRIGNGLYLDGTLLFSLPGQTLIDAAQIAPRGRLIYLARNPDGKRKADVHTLPGDSAPRLSEPAKGYLYVTAGFDGQGYKKLFRVSDTAVKDMLPMSRTADGLTAGPKGILFFHVGVSASPAQAPASLPAGAAGTAAPPTASYGIRLHWLVPESGSVRHLGRTIYNSLPTIKLKWLDEGEFQYTLSDGKSETLNVSEFK